MPSSLLEVCPACGGRQFTAETILWPELLDDWKLSPGEVDYINLQQGFSCVSCKNNLRSMTLAAAVTRAFGFDGSLEHLCARNSAIRQLTVIEMNPAGNLFLPSTSPKTRAAFLPSDRHATNEFCECFDRHHHPFRHVGTRFRLEGSVKRIAPRSETWRPLILHCSYCRWALDQDTAGIAAKLPWEPEYVPRRFQSGNGIRRRCCHIRRRHENRAMWQKAESTDAARRFNG